MASVYVPSEVEEERRLAYVAITRAKEELYIFHAESRMIFGMTNRNRVSRFVEEIPETLVEHTRSRDYSARPVSYAELRRREAVRGSTENKIRCGSRRIHAEAARKARACRYIPRRRYCPAQGVRHGLIVSATPMANDTLLEVAFDKVGTKKLFANFARLTKV